MKILIANAIHVSKDYAIERWLENVAKLQLEYPADLLLIDNSPGTQYARKLEDYCKTKRVKNYKVIHIELPPEQDKFERIARSREVIREIFLSSDYHAWFSWESDILIPVNALGKLDGIMNSGGYVLVAHNNWLRGTDMPNYDWGIALVRRDALEKYSFLFEFGTESEMPDTYEPSEAWFRKRILRGGDTYVEIQGLFTVCHLDM